MPVEKWSDTVVVVHLGNDPQFSEDLESLEERIGQGKVDALLDLSGVGYINSSNIARLLKIRKMMAANDSHWSSAASTTASGAPSSSPAWTRSSSSATTSPPAWPRCRWLRR